LGVNTGRCQIYWPQDLKRLKANNPIWHHLRTSFPHCFLPIFNHEQTSSRYF